MDLYEKRLIDLFVKRLLKKKGGFLTPDRTGKYTAVAVVPVERILEEVRLLHKAIEDHEIAESKDHRDHSTFLPLIGEDHES